MEVAQRNAHVLADKYASHSAKAQRAVVFVAESRWIDRRQPRADADNFPKSSTGVRFPSKHVTPRSEIPTCRRSCSRIAPKFRLGRNGVERRLGSGAAAQGSTAEEGTGAEKVEREKMLAHF